MPAKSVAKAPAPAFPRHVHDHAACMAEALAAADGLCARRGAKLTELRRRVLELVWASHRPIGAYEILAGLGGDGRPAAPPTVYRALDFLLAHGLVHRVESLNAYIGCPEPGHRPLQPILICRDCGAAAEVPDDRIARAVRSAADGAGFAVERQTVEVHGVCRECREEGGAGG